MTKVTCQQCGSSKAKRTCKIKDSIQICSQCCGKLRSSLCEGCIYYDASKRYQSDKPQKERHFITRIDPDIDEECDKVLSLVESGQVARAKELMSELLKKYPDYHMVHYGMGVCCAFQEKMEEAVGFFKKAVNIFPYFTEAHFNMAMAYTKLTDVGGAVKAFREVIRVGGDQKLISEAKRRIDDLEKVVMENYGFNLDTYLKNNETFNRAFTALQKRNFGLAIDLFKQVLSIDPKNVQSWGNLGLAYAGIGKKSYALECLNKALELDPEYELAIVNRFSIKEMMEGECLKGEIKDINYYRDYRIQNRKSYLAEVADELGIRFKEDA